MPVFKRNMPPAFLRGIHSNRAEELRLVLTAAPPLTSVFGSGLTPSQWGYLYAISGMKRRFLCGWQWILDCAKAMGKINSVLGRIRHKMSHVSLGIFHEGRELSCCGWRAQGGRQDSGPDGEDVKKA